jgi:hypothetical protein
MFLLLTGSRGTACAKFVVLIVSVVALKSSWTSVQFLTRASKNKSGTLPQMSAWGQTAKTGTPEQQGRSSFNSGRNAAEQQRANGDMTAVGSVLSYPA